MGDIVDNPQVEINLKLSLTGGLDRIAEIAGPVVMGEKLPGDASHDRSELQWPSPACSHRIRSPDNVANTTDDAKSTQGAQHADEFPA